MILEKDFKEQDNEIIGDADERIEMGIDTENINHLMMIMSTNMYQNPIGSIVREYSSNAIDANVDAGSTDPVIVRLRRDHIGNYFFEVQDYGPGLDDNDFRTIIAKYGKSTKKDRNDQLGYFGLGCKSAFSYSSTFNYTCVKGGKERRYLLYKGDTGFTIDLLHEKDSTERNGVTVRVPVKSWDYSNFRKEIKNQLAYFDNVYFDIENEDLNTGYELYQSTDFQWCNLVTTQEMHITLGRVNYPINWDAIGYSALRVPVALRFDLNSGLFPIPNRENLIWNDKTKELVREKIKAVATWFVEKYNKNVKEMDTLLEAWDFINVTTHYVRLKEDGYSFDVTSLESYSSVKFQEVKIKGVNLIRPGKFKANLDELLREFRIVGEIWNGTLRTKNLWQSGNRYLSDRHKCVLLHDDVVLSGFFRDYLKTLSYTTFVKRKVHIEPDDLDYYKQLLGLKTVPRKDWRATIKEWKDTKDIFIKGVLADGTTIQDSVAYKQFWESSKSKKKAKAQSKAQSKAQGEVSIWCPRRRYNDDGYMFERKVFKLNELHKNKFVTLILTDEEAENIRQYKDVFSKQHVKFAKIGVIDLKKVLNLKLHNFMTASELHKTKLFKRIVTSIRARNAVNLYDTLTYSKVEVVKACAGKFHELCEKVRAYYIKHVEDAEKIRSYDVAKAMLLMAENANIWDESIITEVKELEKGIQDFDFISKLKVPDGRSSTELEEYQNLIHSMLLFKKLRFEDKLGNLEVCVKNDVPLDETQLVNTPVTEEEVLVTN